MTGAVLGAMLLVVPWEPSLIPVGLCFGVISGSVISLIPTLIGTLFIMDLLRTATRTRPTTTATCGTT